MTTTLIKKKLTKAINEIDDAAFLTALHTIVNNKKEEEDIYELSASQKKELDRRRSRHKAGQSRSYTLSSLQKSLIKN